MRAVLVLALLLAASAFQISTNQLASPQQCVEENCGNDLSRCQRDYYCMAALQDCEKQCGNKTTCYTTCLSKWGSPNATSLWKCMLEHNCPDAVSTAIARTQRIQQCISDKCESKWTACRKDISCLPAFEECELRCDKKAICWPLCLSSFSSKTAIDLSTCSQTNKCVTFLSNILMMSSKPHKQ